MSSLGFRSFAISEPYCNPVPEVLGLD